ncbi:MAG: hypothetical protein KF778_12805 [Rhodocyclaceae bacterium]|nr:hypothetical protein [Rhodocyclaceae bacterium]MBX3669272.1 hypothetical protein [Rhodocyclaceae bacterium]
MNRLNNTLLAGALLCMGALEQAGATVTTQSLDANFVSAPASFFGPDKGGTYFSFRNLLGDTNFGLQFNLEASSGTVQSSYRGRVAVSYDNEIILGSGPANLSLSYQGKPGGANFYTVLGADAFVTAFLPIAGALPISTPTVGLIGFKQYTPSPPNATTTTAQTPHVTVAVGPNIGVGGAQAGIDFNLSQFSKHVVSGMSGTILATHVGDGQTRTGSFSLAGPVTVPLDLDLTGTWDIQLTNISLANLFNTQISLNFSAFAYYYLGINCGDPGSDLDNGFGCIDDAEISTSRTGFTLFNSRRFALDMLLQTALPSFQVNVVAPDEPPVGPPVGPPVAPPIDPPPVDTQVPVLPPYMLLGAGLAAMGIIARRRRMALDS